MRNSIQLAAILFFIIVFLISLSKSGGKSLIDLTGINALIFSAGIFIFVLLVAALTFFGFEYSKSDLIFLPIVLGIGLMIALFLVNTFQISSPPPTPTPPTQSQPTDVLSNGGTLTPTPTSLFPIITRVTTTVYQRNTLPFWDILLQGMYVAVFLVAILLLVIIIHSILKSTTEVNEVNILEQLKYTESSDPKQRSIFRIYRDTCYRIEGKIGQAPKWYTPTSFLFEVIEIVGSPMSDYFDVLTNIYEKARFSSHMITDTDVNEAADVSEQIKLVMKKLKIDLSSELDGEKQEAGEK